MTTPHRPPLALITFALVAVVAAGVLAWLDEHQLLEIHDVAVSGAHLTGDDRVREAAALAGARPWTIAARPGPAEAAVAALPAVDRVWVELDSPLDARIRVAEHLPVAVADVDDRDGAWLVHPDAGPIAPDDGQRLPQLTLPTAGEADEPSAELAAALQTLDALDDVDDTLADRVVAVEVSDAATVALQLDDGGHVELGLAEQLDRKLDVAAAALDAEPGFVRLNVAAPRRPAVVPSS